MSIDEAIAHAREVAKEQKRRSGVCVANDNECDKFSNCIKCAEEHEQLAKWLEELKALRITVSELQCELQATGALLEERDEETRNKAIDDFKEKIKEKISESFIWGMLVDSHKDNSFNDTSDKIVDYIIETSKEIAEQLKDGGVNE